MVKKLFGFILGGILATCIMHAQSGWYPLQSNTQSLLIGIASVSPDDVWVISQDSLLLHTTNGGERWDSVHLALQGEGDRLSFSRIRFVSATIGFIVGFYHRRSDGSQRTLILRTSNGGVTWNKYQADTLGRVSDISFPMAEIGYICGYSSSGPFAPFVAVTTDGGDTWIYRGSPHDFYNLSFRSPLVGLAGFSSEPYTGLARTMDGGVTWQQVSAPFVLINYDAVHGSGNEWTLGTDRGILRTTDDGDNWTRVDSLSSAWGIGFYNDRIGYAVSGDYGNPRLIRQTTDGGVTWRVHDTDIPSVSALYAIAAPGEKVAYAVGAGGVILKTSDGGGPSLSVPEDVPTNRHSLSASSGAGVIQLRFEPSDIERRLLLYNLLGENLREISIPVQSTVLDIGIGGLASGVYLCRLGSESVPLVVAQ